MEGGGEEVKWKEKGKRKEKVTGREL